MIDHSETLWHTVLFASEIDLKGIDSLSENDKLVLEQNPELHLMALKQKKQNVEYQFTNHKLIMAKYYQDYRCKKITLEQYDELRIEQMAWRTKAASFLSRIEQKISQIKINNTYAN